MTQRRWVPAPGLTPGLCYGLMLLAVAGRSAVAPPEFKLDSPLVLTQVPREGRARPAAWDPTGLARGDGFSGARLVVVTPDGQVRALSEGFDSACDPNVSFDGERVLFAGKREPGARWRIWEIGLDGQGLRAVSPEGLDARSPLHVSTLFTLDSPQPWFTTVFVGREQTLDEQGRPEASSLYNIKLDGTELRRLTFGPDANLDPMQMVDGRLVYAAGRYPNQPGARRGRLELCALHIEGADMELYGGEGGRRVQQMPCATGGGLVVFVESDEAARDGAGQLASVEARRPHLTYRPLTRDAAWVFSYPSPWQGNLVLVSRRSAKGRDLWGVYGFDADQGVCARVFASPDHHALQAVLARPRTRPDGHSTVVEARFDSGIFYGLNSYDADPRMVPHLQAGTIKRVRFVEGVPQPADASRPAARSHGPWVPRRLIGEAPVEADGSFNVEVPADIPLLLQTLDERGLALANCGWVWVKPNEKRGCIGCHEDPERTPENEYVLALRRPSNRLVLPAAQRRAISFGTDIAPLVQKHCATAGCHGGKETPLQLSLAADPPSIGDLEKAYAALLAPAAGKGAKATPWPQAGRYVDPGRARTSWLIWQLVGSDTSRPWDHGEAPAKAPSHKITPMPPPGRGQPLSPEELRTFIQWIDLGAPFEAPPAPAQPAAK
jgi:hypothetical protein